MLRHALTRRSAAVLGLGALAAVPVLVSSGGAASADPPAAGNPVVLPVHLVSAVCPPSPTPHGCADPALLEGRVLVTGFRADATLGLVADGTVTGSVTRLDMHADLTGAPVVIPIGAATVDPSMVTLTSAITVLEPVVAGVSPEAATVVSLPGGTWDAHADVLPATLVGLPTASSGRHDDNRWHHAKTADQQAQVLDDVLFPAS